VGDQCCFVSQPYRNTRAVNFVRCDMKLLEQCGDVCQRPDLAVVRTKRWSGIWFETDMSSSCFAVHVWGPVLECLR